jgi:hypothetical protein
MTGTEPDHDFPKIPQPAVRALLGAGYSRMEQLTGVTKQELLQLHGMGPKAMGILQAELETRGLSFAGERKD